MTTTDPARTAMGWQSARGPLPKLPTDADATQCATCCEQGVIYQRDPDGVYRPWICEACGGTGRRA